MSNKSFDFAVVIILIGMALANWWLSGQIINLSVTLFSIELSLFSLATILPLVLIVPNRA